MRGGTSGRRRGPALGRPCDRLRLLDLPHGARLPGRRPLAAAGGGGRMRRRAGALAPLRLGARGAHAHGAPAGALVAARRAAHAARRHDRDPRARRARRRRLGRRSAAARRRVRDAQARDWLGFDDDDKANHTEVPLARTCLRRSPRAPARALPAQPRGALRQHPAVDAVRSSAAATTRGRRCR